jgi:hypothetical protein
VVSLTGAGGGSDSKAGAAAIGPAVGAVSDPVSRQLRAHPSNRLINYDNTLVNRPPGNDRPGEDRAPRPRGTTASLAIPFSTDNYIPLPRAFFTLGIDN